MFKVGDLVRANHYLIKGTCGKIVEFDGRWFGIDFGKKFIGSHDLEGRITTNTGYWLMPENLEYAKYEYVKQFIKKNL